MQPRAGAGDARLTIYKLQGSEDLRFLGVQQKQPRGRPASESAHQEGTAHDWRAHHRQGQSRGAAERAGWGQARRGMVDRDAFC